MNLNMNQFQNYMNYENNTHQNNKINLQNKAQFYQMNNMNINTNLNNNIYSHDKRLILCLKNLGLTKYIPNFLKKKLKFEDFLSLSNSDFTSLKIPVNIQDIIQNFMIAYFNYGSLYTIEEIIQFFKTKKVKKYIQRNEQINERNGNRNNINIAKYRSVNNKKISSNNYINNINYQNNNLHNNELQRNINNNMNNYSKRPKSQNNKIINYQNYFIDYPNTNYISNNIDENITSKNNNIRNNINNFRKPQKNMNNIKRQNIPNNNLYDVTTNSNSNKSSLQSSKNNFNFYSPSIDNFSHIAMKENSPQMMNIMKNAKYKNMNNNININHLKKNLAQNYSKTTKNINNNKTNNNNMNNRNKKILNKSKPKDIIERMNEVLQRNELRKRSSNSSSNFTKGYYSDGYLKEKYRQQIQKNTNLEGYEINTFYAGDTSKFSSLLDNYSNSNLYSELQKMNNKVNMKHSKANKFKKMNEDQTRKIEYLLDHGPSSVKINNDMMDNYNINYEDNNSLYNDEQNYNYLLNMNNSNNINQKLFSKKNNYNNQVNNKNSLKHKNLLIQRQNYQNKLSKNKPNNFNTYASNRKNITSNDDNIISIYNPHNKIKKDEGPIQISVNNKKKINKNNNYANIPQNYNNIMQRGNYNENKNLMNNFVTENKIKNNFNFQNYPLDIYSNTFTMKNNNKQRKNYQSYEKQKKNRIYAGIHNINNNINNININNINYDGKRISHGYNDLMDFDINMNENYNLTHNNFYAPNNMEFMNNNNDYLSEVYQ